MPIIEEVIERLQGAKVFTTLDLENGFFHVPVAKDSIKFTSFITRSGQFEFLYMPFGISNAPAVFCRYIAAVFRELILKGVMTVYMDDIVVAAKDEDDGVRKLKMVLEQASAYGLKINWGKCQILQEKIDFLGYVIEKNTIRPSREKTSAIRNFPIPITGKSLQRFLGLTSYFRQFVENYATIAKPLSDLLRKNIEWHMGDEQVAAFQQLKQALINPPILQIYNPQAETEVHTDACQSGYGAVLVQRLADDSKFHPVQYMSRKTKPAEEKYHSYELEVLAIIEALKKWRVFVMGIKIKIVTDCKAFQLTMQEKDVPTRVARWAMFLQEFDYVIEHRSGSKMKHVDALSRVACLLIEDSLSHRLAAAQKSDDWVRAIAKVLEGGDYEDYYVKRGIVYKDLVKELLVIPESMEQEIITIAHRQGHYAANKTQEIIEKTYFIRRIREKVVKIVKNCVECIIINEKSGKREGFICPIDKGEDPLSTLHLDHVGPMESTKKAYNYILTVVDGFSKFVWLYPTKSTGAEAVVECMKRQAALFGNPRRVITDRGTAFTALVFKQYCEDQSIQHLLIATGVPRGNGQVERLHRVVVPMLAKLSQPHPERWYRYVNQVQQTINNTPPRSTKFAPFKILTGIDMRVAGIPELQKLLEEDAENQLEDVRREIRAETRKNIEVIQRENLKGANARRCPAEVYQIGDLVAIKRTQYGAGLKLRPRYIGPYRVTAVREHDRYEVARIGQHEGPLNTRTVAEFMKRWR